MNMRWFAGAALLTLAPLMHAACMDEEPFIISPVNVPCTEDCDCYSGDKYLLGTGCYNGICRCPPQFTWMYAFPCCEKDRPIDDCRRQCRAIEECAPDEVDEQFLPPGTVWPPEGDGVGGAGGAGSVSSSSSSSSGDVVKPECEQASDCPTPEEPRCADAVCDKGKCGFLLKTVQKIQSQIKGDCVSQYCDGQGKIIVLPDGEDAYNDGKQCTIDQCKNSVSMNVAFPDGSPCPETGIGVCYQGACVDCISSIAPSCPGGLACYFTSCEPMHCENSVFEPVLGETAQDCGGPCFPCAVGFGCAMNADCIDGVCLGGLCQAPTCSDGAKNGAETGIDCGGPPSCPRCAAGQGCAVPGDCESGVCWAGVCEGA